MTARALQAVRQFFARIGESFRRRTIAAELRAELETHLEMEVEHNVRRGMSEADARRAALLAFGGIQRFREEAADARGFITLEHVGRDLRYAVRRLRRAPIFTLGVVVTLGIGVGCAVGLGALTYAVLLRPLPYPDPDRVVRIEVETPGLGTTTINSSPGIYQMLAERLESIAVIGSYYENDQVTIGGRAQPERTTAAMVTPSVFRILKTQPVVGRLFDDEKSSDDTIPVLIGFDVWQRHFGGDTTAIGRTIELNRAPRRVIGVLPRGFAFPSPEVGVWFATSEAATTAGLSDRYLSVIGRLRDGATVEQASAEVATIAAGIATRFPELGAEAVRDSRLQARVVSLRSATVAPARGELILLGALGVLVLVIAFTNVTTLVLLRAESVRGEIAVSQALGAGAGAVAQRLIAEDLVLGAGGLILAVPIVFSILETKLGFAADQLPRMHEVHAGPATLAAATVAALAIGGALGLISVARTRNALAEGGIIGQGSRGTSSVAWRRSRQALVAAQVAMAIAVLLSSGLMAKSLRRLHEIDFGFASHGGATFGAPLPYSSYERYQKVVAFHLQVVDGLRRLPGVKGAAAAMSLPLTSIYSSMANRVESSGSTRTSHATSTANVVTPEYFSTMAIPLHAGRTFTRGDYAGANPSIIVSRSLAKTLFGDDDPIGKAVRLSGERQYPTYRVVGVVGDVYGNRIADGPLRSLYFPFVDDLAPASMDGPRIPYVPSAHYVVRSDAALAALVPRFRQIVASIDPRLPVTDVRTLDDLVASATARARIATTLLALAAVAALLLGAIGLYTVIAFTVAGRSREFAVRIAVGASSRSIIRLVFREGVAILAIGCVGGFALSIGGMGLIQNVLYDVSAHDLSVLAATFAVVATTATIAIYLPARRAAATDPVRVLRAS